MGVLILLGLIIYVILAISFLWGVSKKIQGMPTRRKRNFMAVAVLLVLLFPTWDVLLAYVIQFPYCWFWGGEKVIESVEAEGVYYDLETNRWGLSQGLYKSYFTNGLRYVEMNVTGFGTTDKEKGPRKYWINNGKLEFSKIDKIESNYEITDKSFKMTVIPLYFYEKRIIDRNNGNIKAYERKVYTNYLSIGIIPFFNWLNWDDHFVFNKQFCPSCSPYFYHR